MNYWLIKTEPETFSWDDLVRLKRDMWDGVRNYTARLHLMNMKKGDLAFFYHSVNAREIVGIAEVVKEHYPDPTTDDDRWVVVDFKPKRALKRPINLSEIKADKRLQEMALIRISRLSVQPVAKKEWDIILKMEEKPPKK